MIPLVHDVGFHVRHSLHRHHHGQTGDGVVLGWHHSGWPGALDFPRVHKVQGLAVREMNVRVKNESDDYGNFMVDEVMLNVLRRQLTY